MISPQQRKDPNCNQQNQAVIKCLQIAALVGKAFPPLPVTTASPYPPPLPYLPPHLPQCSPYEAFSHISLHG